MMNIRSIIREALEEDERKRYLSWKRKNVSFRGLRDDAVGNENGGMARFGVGLYSAALSNRKMSREYGTSYFLVNAVPKNPKIFNNTNECEIWIQQNLYKKFSNDGFPDSRKFSEKTTIEAEMQKMGYDGIIIKGREMVNYSPPNDVRYFRESQKGYRNIPSVQGSRSDLRANSNALYPIGSRCA